MSVWISDEKLLIFASLISPSKMILFEKKYQTFDTVFHHQMKHLEVRQKYSAARRIFNSLLGVSSGDETLHLMFDILHQEFTVLLFTREHSEQPCLRALLYVQNIPDFMGVFWPRFLKCIRLFCHETDNEMSLKGERG